MQHGLLEGEMTVASYSPRLLRVWGLFFWSVFVLTLIRVLYLAWNYSHLRSPELGEIFRVVLHGLRFDLAASAWLILPLIFLSLIPWPARGGRIWEGGVLILFFLIQLPFWTLNLIDVEFVNFVGRRLSKEVLFILSEAQGKAGGFLMAYGLLMALATGVLLIGGVGAWWIFRRSQCLHQVSALKGWKVGVGLALGSVIFTVVLTRGGLQEKPIHFVNAQVFQNPALNLAVLNSTFTILKSLGQKELPAFQFFEKTEEVAEILSKRVTGPSLMEGRRPSKAQNVVVLILESFGLEYMGKVNGVPGYTPFLDSLAEKSLFFPNAFANGRRSIEGIPAVLSSMPALMNEPFVTSAFSNGEFPGLGRLLHERGFETSFFHGGNNGTMHFDAYTEGSGIRRYFGSKEYPNSKDHDGVWGIYDGPMLQWMKRQMDGMKEPFFVSFFSISSHNPYLIPEDRRDRYEEGPLPILKTIRYTDESLKEFFEEAAKAPWYENTLFVITADHTYLPYLPEFDHDLGRFQIPVLFFHPKYEWPKGIDTQQVVQQIDILPSILDFLGMEGGENRLASSVFVPGEKFATVYVDGQATVIENQYFLTWSQAQGAKLFSRQDPHQKRPLEMPEVKERLEKRLKASLQYFGSSMRENRWQ